MDKHRLFLKAGNGMMRHFGPEELPPQDGWQSADLAGDLVEVPHDGQRLPAEKQRIGPRVVVVFRLNLRPRAPDHSRLACCKRESAHCGPPAFAAPLARCGVPPERLSS